MTPPAFELTWRGGATEARLRERRPGIDELPWGTLAARVASSSAIELEAARRAWSEGVFTEYASAAAFSALTTELARCGAPVDLVACCADIVVDELCHVELASRLVAELGGGVPVAFDLANIAPVAGGTRPLLRAAELAITTSCMGETLSVTSLSRGRAVADEPLVRAVLDRLVADEGPHARCGYWILDWAIDRLVADERDFLARIAEAAISAYAPLWRDDPACEIAVALREAVETGIAAPLARYGIDLDRGVLDALVGPTAAP